MLILNYFENSNKSKTPSPRLGPSTPREPRTVHAGSDFGHKVSQDIYNNTTPVARLSQSAGRPVPNPSAFESGVDELMASHASEKSDATPNKKVCPPTPQRTPTWMAQSHNSYRRDEDDDELLQGDSMDGMDGMARAHFRRGPDVDDDPLCLSDLQDDGMVTNDGSSSRRRGRPSPGGFGSKMSDAVDDDLMELDRSVGDDVGDVVDHINNINEEGTWKIAFSVDLSVLIQPSP